MTPAQLALVGGAAAAAGFVNAVAGGGSLLSFPALLATGVPAVQASLTNTIALCPGYLGGTFAQRRELAGQGRRLAIALPAGAAGGAVGALLLLHTGAAGFAVVVPALLVLAVVLLALQPRLTARLRARSDAGRVRSHGALAVGVPVGLAAIYGGYFGAGLGVILLAGLAAVLDDTLSRLNALKQAASLAANVAAAVWFVSRARFDLATVIVMAATSLIGGVAGGALASRVPARVLRGIVIAIGLAVAVAYAIKLAA